MNQHATALALPYLPLAAEIAALLQDASVRVPARLVQTLPGGGSLFVMPALDARIAMTKLITYTPANAARGLPTIQGQMMVFDNVTGAPVATLDGPTVTARRTAAVSLLAAQRLAAIRQGPLLIIGAGVQGRSHLEAFIEGLGVREVLVHSRSLASAHALVEHATQLFAHCGIQGSARTVDTPDALATALPQCPIAVTCTPAQEHVLHDAAQLHPQAFVCAVGAFTAQMAELAPRLVQHFAAQGSIVVDTADAAHEAGDLLQAGMDSLTIARHCSTLQQVVQKPVAQRGLTLFKSCGWAGWDLAAARLAAGWNP